jgi:hypothetical protein
MALAAAPRNLPPSSKRTDPGTARRAPGIPAAEQHGSWFRVKAAGAGRSEPIARCAGYRGAMARLQRTGVRLTGSVDHWVVPAGLRVYTARAPHPLALSTVKISGGATLSRGADEMRSTMPAPGAQHDGYRSSVPRSHAPGPGTRQPGQGIQCPGTQQGRPVAACSWLRLPGRQARGSLQSWRRDQCPGASAAWSLGLGTLAALLA